MRSYKSLLDEIGVLIEEHGAKEIFDDTGTFPAGEWLRNFCRGMIERDYHKEILFNCNMRYGFLKPDHIDLMAKANFRKLKVGLESANQETLDRLNKGIKVQNVIEDSKMISEAGMEVHLTIMVGYPWETRDDAKRTLDLAKKLMNRGYASMLQSTVVIPYPGTLLYQQAIENDWFRIDPSDYDRYGMTEPVLKTPDMEPKEVVDMCGKIYRNFFKFEYIWQQLRRVRSWEDVDYLTRGAKAIWGHLADFGKVRN